MRRLVGNFVRRSMGAYAMTRPGKSAFGLDASRDALSDLNLWPRTPDLKSLAVRGGG